MGARSAEAWRRASCERNVWREINKLFEYEEGKCDL